jgi:hypothetical protein
VRRALLLAVATATLYTGSVQAQGPTPGAGYTPGIRPVYSPYLNLLNRGQSAGANYYGLVRPQLAFSGALQGLETQQAATAAEQNSFEAAVALPATGHTAGFMSHTRYFMTNRTGAGAQGGRFGAAVGPAPGVAAGALPGMAQGAQGQPGTAPKSGRR